MKISVLITRSLLGIIYLVFGLNFFLNFIPMPKEAVSPKVGAFMSGLIGAGYFFAYMKAIEVIGGLLLLVNRFTIISLLVLLPITINIFLFHAVLSHEGLPIGAVMLIIHLFLGYAYKKYYGGLFVQNATE